MKKALNNYLLPAFLAVLVWYFERRGLYVSASMFALILVFGCIVKVDIEIENKSNQ